MSNMSQSETLHGVPLTLDDPSPLSLGVLALTKSEKDEIENAGISVTGIRIASPGAPPRYFISFKPDMPSFKARSVLEKLGYDIGQQMIDAGKMLRFYVSKRSIETKSWD